MQWFLFWDDFIFFGTKNRQMVTQFFEMEYSVTNSLFFGKKKKNRQKATENWFFGEGVTMFMLIGYSFQGFLK